MRLREVSLPRHLCSSLLRGENETSSQKYNLPIPGEDRNSYWFLQLSGNLAQETQKEGSSSIFVAHPGWRSSLPVCKQARRALAAVFSVIFVHRLRGRNPLREAFLRRWNAAQARIAQRTNRLLCIAIHPDDLQLRLANPLNQQIQATQEFLNDSQI